MAQKGGGSTARTLSAFKIQVRSYLLELWLHRIGEASTAAFPIRVRTSKTDDEGTRAWPSETRGYFDTGLFEQEEQAGDYSLSRSKAGQLKLFDEQGNELDLLSFLKEQATDQDYDGWVHVGATRRRRSRLLAIPVPETVAIQRQQAIQSLAQKHGRTANPLLLDLSKWTLILTTIGPELLSIQEAIVLLVADGLACHSPCFLAFNKLPVV